MATNDFVPVAPGPSANVPTQSAYLADPAVTTGYQSGVAKSAFVNKSLRQGTTMAAVLAQLIVDVTGQNALDDGTTATLLSNLKAAIRAQSSPVGSARNMRSSNASASTTATWTADEVIVETALGGQTYRLASFNKSINTATVGAGGMDTGTAPVSGFLAVYAIYNPATGASAVLGVNASTLVQPEIYGGANMPSGYTASALIAIVPTNASAQMSPFLQIDRGVDFLPVTVLSNGIIQTTPAVVNIPTAVPKNAKKCSGSLGTSSSTTATSLSLSIFSSSNGVGVQGSNSTGSTVPFRDCKIATTTQIWYTTANTAGTPNFVINISGYEF